MPPASGSTKWKLRWAVVAWGVVVRGGPGQQAAQGAEVIRNRVLLAVHIQAVDAGGVGAHGADPCAAVGGGPGGLLLKAAAHQQGYVVPSNQKSHPAAWRSRRQNRCRRPRGRTAAPAGGGPCHKAAHGGKAAVGQAVLFLGRGGLQGYHRAVAFAHFVPQNVQPTPAQPGGGSPSFRRQRRQSLNCGNRSRRVCASPARPGQILQAGCRRPSGWSGWPS